MHSAQQGFEVMLPVGYTDGQGHRQRRALIRKMRGHEEALLYDSALSAGRLVTELLRSCLIQLGEAQAPPAPMVSALYTADRNYLLMQIRRITLGDRMMAHYPCPHCGTDVAVVEDLGALAVRSLGEEESLQEICVALEDGYQDTCGTLHTELSLTLPSGEDEEFVSPMAERDPLKAQDALLLRCITRFGSLSKTTLEAYGVKILRDLSMGDRLRLQGALNQGLPGMDLSRSLQCEACATPFEGVIDMSNFFAMG